MFESNLYESIMFPLRYKRSDNRISSLELKNKTEFLFFAEEIFFNETDA